jgi:APA family basic amino acid/polyamine antiporter
MAAVIATLFWYHRHQSHEPVSFRVPLFPLLPLVFLAAVLWIVAVTAWDHPADAGMGLLITLLGLPVYWFWARSRPSRA